MANIGKFVGISDVVPADQDVDVVVETEKVEAAVKADEKVLEPTS